MLYYLVYQPQVAEGAVIYDCQITANRMRNKNSKLRIKTFITYADARSFMRRLGRPRSPQKQEPIQYGLDNAIYFVPKIEIQIDEGDETPHLLYGGDYILPCGTKETFCLTKDGVNNPTFGEILAITSLMARHPGVSLYVKTDNMDIIRTYELYRQNQLGTPTAKTANLFTVFRYLNKYNGTISNIDPFAVL